MTLLRSLLGAALLMTASVSAHAYTECTGRVARIFADSSVYVWFDNGLTWQKAAWFGSTTVELQSQATVKNILAVATTGMTTGRSVTVRFVADGVSCSGDKQALEVWGVYLNAT
ncbi:hypothetical protein [Steroidobacter cummioxidans]|uniref:hypothetical protein n=1 Tax=Steroidobacter cummioxidans TaxID=1803913 RepID=UPI000E3243F7|nr:hypothetical protein [Steroidobacter cummioxidans]